MKYFVKCNVLDKSVVKKLSMAFFYILKNSLEIMSGQLRLVTVSQLSYALISFNSKLEYVNK